MGPTYGGPMSVRLRWFAGAALAAAALTVVEGPLTVPVVLAVIVAFAPWVVELLGRELPVVLFAAWALVPVAYLVAVHENDASMFLATVAVSWVASRTSSRRVVVPVVAVGAALIFTDHLGAGRGNVLDDGALYFAFGVVFGALVGMQLRRETELTAQLRVAQAQLASAGAADERRRIARDVHDIVGHSLTVVVLHIAGARRLIPLDPPAAVAALLEAERVGRDSLDAMRDVVGLLRDADPGGAGGPVKGSTYDVTGVVDAFRQAGGQVELEIAGELSTLPAAAAATLYRFVQEALTNAGRHGVPGAAARVRVRVGSDGVEAEARNALPETRSTEPHGGHGLQGMRERVAALGGELRAGPDGGQWVVSCRVPTGGGPGA